MTTPLQDAELREALEAISGIAVQEPDHTIEFFTYENLIAFIRARDEQRESQIQELSRILDKYGTSKCDECSEYLHDDDMAWCENCPRSFHESCAGHTYDGDGEYPSESAYALCTRCTNPQEQDKEGE